MCLVGWVVDARRTDWERSRFLGALWKRQTLEAFLVHRFSTRANAIERTHAWHRQQQLNDLHRRTLWLASGRCRFGSTGRTLSDVRHGRFSLDDSSVLGWLILGHFGCFLVIGRRSVSLRDHNRRHHSLIERLTEKCNCMNENINKAILTQLEGTLGQGP